MGCGGSAPAEAVSAPQASNGAGNAVKTSSASESRNIDQEIERAKVRKSGDTQVRHGELAVSQGRETATWTISYNFSSPWDKPPQICV